MDPYWLIDEASFTGVREARPGAGAAQPSGAGTGAPFLTQIERVLGEETAPDAAFFMDSWTVGVSAASDNFLRRQERRKSRDAEMPAWNPSSFFTPFFVARVEAPAEVAWPLRESRPEQGSMADRQWRDGEEEKDGPAADEAEDACPQTLESACRMLGVTATGTREQIRAAYRKMASRYHPDRLACGGPREQKLASHRMASINEAYRLLCAGLPGQQSPC